MVDKKISELNTAATVYDADDFALVQDGDTKQVNASAVKTYVKDGLIKSDVGLGNVDNTSDAAKNSAAATLTNKTISGSTNTLSNIGNSSLTNSSITINGNAVSLGGSTTVSAATTNTLTIGTGLSGTSFDGSAATTIAIDSSVVTLTGTQTLTNKTLTSPVISGGTANNVAIGGTTPAAGAFTTLSSTGNTTLGGASTDTVTVNGCIGVGGAANTLNGITCVHTSTGNNGNAVFGVLTALSTSGCTDSTGIFGKVAIPDAAFTYVNAYGFYAGLNTKGASATLTNSYGVYINDQTQGTNNYGITSLVSSGTNKWNIYASGTANNYFAGNVGIGTSSPVGRLHSLVTTAGDTALSLQRSGSARFEFINGILGVTGDTLQISDTTNSRDYLMLRNGNVGIGTSSPGVKLDAVGAVRSTDEAASINTVGSGLISSRSTNDSSLYIGYRTTPDAFVISATYISNGAFKPIVFATSDTERMRIDSAGNVGIGITPSNGLSRLQIKQPSANRYGAIIYASANDAFLQIGHTGTVGVVASTYATTAGYTPLTFWTSDTERARITSGGEFYVAGTTDQGAYNIQCNGTGVWGAGAYVNGSDARIKEDVAPISSSLDVVNKLNPVTYKYKESWSKDRSTQTGFIAQELQTVLADEIYLDGVVQQGPEYMSVAYQNIIPILTKAIQELHAEIELLKAKVN